MRNTHEISTMLKGGTDMIRQHSMATHRGHNILIVDDEPMILNALKRLFHRHEFSVLTAESGVEALKIMDSQPVSVVISDMKMPEMNGATFLGRVAISWPKTIRISLTGYADIEDTINVINEAGIFRYISKPWDDAELIEIIELAFETLDKNDSQKQAHEETSKHNKELLSKNVELEKEIITKSARLEKTSDKLASAYEGEVKLRMAQKEAEKLNEAKGRFLASMSHEMRSPLNAIIAMNKLLLDSNLSEDQRELARLAHDGGQTLLSLINDILDFSKIEAEKLALHKEWFDLKDTVENVSDLMASQAINKPVEVAVVFSPGTPREVFGDETRIKQILINIISNAIKFTERGGVSIKVSPLKAGLQFIVKDTGIGIPKNQQNRIFEEFFQADNSNTRSYGGTGLGLSICNQLLKMMGGHIGVTSDKDMGSCFRVYLPIESRTSVVFDKCLQSRHLVFVDTKNAILCEAIREQLSYFSCDVVSLSEMPISLDEYDRFTIVYDIEDRNLPALEYKKRLHEKIGDKYDFDDLESMSLVGIIANDAVGEVGGLRRIGYGTILRKPIKLDQLEGAVIDEVSAESLCDDHDKDYSKTISTANDHKDHPNIRILLVEDSPANQAVVKAILQNRHDNIEIANNGREAVEAALINPYDIILMDLSMPIMDGLEATKMIRLTPGPNHDTTIIAMTANAFTEDREKCIKAGMDDYISKPIDVPTFLLCLDNWSSKNLNNNLADNGVKNDEGDNQPRLIRLETLDQLVKDTSESILPTILSIYYDETESRIPLMMSLFEGQDWKGLKDEAHTLKSSSGSFGADILFEKAKKIEELITKRQFDNVDREMRGLASLSRESIEQLKSYCMSRTLGGLTDE